MSTTTRTAEQRWSDFRTARDAALAEPHGWLTITSFQWLADSPGALEGVPGTWTGTATHAAVTAESADGLTDLTSGRPVTGTITATLGDEESLSWVAFGGTEGRRVVVELARRAGRYAVRTRDAEAPTLTHFTGVPVFGYRPDLVVEGRFEPFTAPREEMIATAHPDVPGKHRTVGEVVFRLPGEDGEFRLRASQEEAGSLAITFHDRTNGASTAAWRKVVTRRPRPDGTVLLDFNRTINYPSAFSPFGTCPAPVAGNVLAAPVEAGEKRPEDRRDGDRTAAPRMRRVQSRVSG
ncbi:DUF1684 domain-containing protein [Arthrobacter bussei]|uniref:DUF1684 domain-containing protein n=1 Tax=Arthrobacter bussei TaxID=2594179 RepID=A0A7X1NP06_9MICC|nr:DUF1684 domain-containing protein [Arthrobacter bussei]MPY10334.1 DUF1684 domain-containing protein [Arthrobacter bussei]